MIKDSTKKKNENNNIKKIKNIISDKTPNDNNDFDVLFIVDATGSMAIYIKAAKEETKNISDELRHSYPEMMFKYGYIFYRDPIDSKGDIHETIDLTDNVNSFPEKIGKIKADGGGDIPEDWVGAYKIANEKISWRNGIKMIIHLTDAGAHGKLFTRNDKYPEEEEKLIKELVKCIEKNIEIIGYVIEEESRNTFDECCKIYRNKGGSYEICDFIQEKKVYRDYSMKEDKDICYDMDIPRECCLMMNEKMEERNDFQSEVNMNFRMNAVRNVGERMKMRNKDI